MLHCKRTNPNAPVTTQETCPSSAWSSTHVAEGHSWMNPQSVQPAWSMAKVSHSHVWPAYAGGNRKGERRECQTARFFACALCALDCMCVCVRARKNLNWVGKHKKKWERVTCGAQAGSATGLKAGAEQMQRRRHSGARCASARMRKEVWVVVQRVDGLRVQTFALENAVAAMDALHYRLQKGGGGACVTMAGAGTSPLLALGCKTNAIRTNGGACEIDLCDKPEKVLGVTVRAGDNGDGEMRYARAVSVNNLCGVATLSQKLDTARLGGVCARTRGLTVPHRPRLFFMSLTVHSVWAGKFGCILEFAARGGHLAVGEDARTVLVRGGWSCAEALVDLELLERMSLGGVWRQRQFAVQAPPLFVHMVVLSGCVGCVFNMEEGNCCYLATLCPMYAPGRVLYSGAALDVTHTFSGQGAFWSGNYMRRGSRTYAA